MNQTWNFQLLSWAGAPKLGNGANFLKNIISSFQNYIFCQHLEFKRFDLGPINRVFEDRGVNVRPNPRTRHEPDTGFFGLELDLNGFES